MGDLVPKERYLTLQYIHISNLLVLHIKSARKRLGVVGYAWGTGAWRNSLDLLGEGKSFNASQPCTKKDRLYLNQNETAAKSSCKTDLNWCLQKAGISWRTSGLQWFILERYCLTSLINLDGDRLEEFGCAKKWYLFKRTEVSYGDVRMSTAVEEGKNYRWYANVNSQLKMGMPDCFMLNQTRHFRKPIQLAIIV